MMSSLKTSRRTWLALTWENKLGIGNITEQILRCDYIIHSYTAIRSCFFMCLSPPLHQLLLSALHTWQSWNRNLQVSGDPLSIYSLKAALQQCNRVLACLWHSSASLWSDITDFTAYLSLLCSLTGNWERRFTSRPSCTSSETVSYLTEPNSVSTLTHCTRSHQGFLHTTGM